MRSPISMAKATGLMCRCRELELPRSHRLQQGADGVWALSGENRWFLAELQVGTGKVLPCRALKGSAESRFADGLQKFSHCKEVTGLAV